MVKLWFSQRVQQKTVSQPDSQPPCYSIFNRQWLWHVLEYYSHHYIVSSVQVERHGNLTFHDFKHDTKTQLARNVQAQTKYEINSYDKYQWYSSNSSIVFLRLISFPIAFNRLINW